jgi:predicted AAA+ superfamily ATPase
MADLCPAQQSAYDGLLRGLPRASIFLVSGDTGCGRTTVLRAAHAAVGGAFLTMRDLTEAMVGSDPLALEEIFTQRVVQALRGHQHVFVDDLHLLTAVTTCHSFYPRHGWLNAPITALLAGAIAAGKKLIFGSGGGVPPPVRERCFAFEIGDFEVADYEHLGRAYLPAATAARLDYRKIHRFASRLNAHQLRTACEWLAPEGNLDTEQFVDYLRARRLASNVDLGEVQAVDLRDLLGVDDVIESLEANIVLPLENDALAEELDLRPKRGVLLIGPPGTGKTTVGRALAHRLKSKFFLIDGTFISGTHEFYERVQQIFEHAKANAPAILFIDDSDVIFENQEELGLYRYLLTMLDGLESQSAGRVCVMMTAMNVANLPPALLRSGRIELWLSMRLPDEAARAAILQAHLARLPAPLAGAELPPLVTATDGFTGADLKRLVEDSKTLYAYDRARAVPLRPVTDYFLAAVETVRSNKERYAEAEAAARLHRPQRPPWFGMMSGMPDGGDE